MDLKPFCATGADPREHLRAPWKHGAFVYATNGVACVRVPAESRPDITETPSNVPNAGALFERTFEREGDFLLLPPVPVVPKCIECEGAGTVRAIKCPDCVDGFFVRGYHVYECKNCEDSVAGPGWERVYGEAPEQQVQRCCDFCDGRGYPVGIEQVKLGAVLYDASYLALFAALPQVRIRPGDPSTDKYDPNLTPAAFIFDGGQGLLMPRRA